MGRLVKLIGSAIGLTSEAIAARRSSSSARASNSANSTDGARNYKYVDLPEERAQELIAKDQAVPLDVKDAKGTKDTKNKDYDSDSDDTVVEDEVEWELDDALKENPSAEESMIGKEPQYTVDEFVKSFSTAHPLPPIAPPVGRLPCPVIIPQRRPHSKSRGFIRAYAPVLSECGIDQDSFLYFLKMFHRESKVCMRLLL